MSYTKARILRVNRQITGYNVSGEIYHATNYFYSTQIDEHGAPTGFIALYARFNFTNALGEYILEGQQAIFLINTNGDDLALIEPQVRGDAELNDNWKYYDKGIIDSQGQAMVLINRNEIGLFAIAAYCPLSVTGSEITITLGV